MKFAWEPSDIRAGVRVGQAGRREQWIIGYDPAISDTHNPFCLVSLTDGMLSRQKQSAADLAELLTKAGDYPVCFFDFVEAGGNQ